MTGLSLGYVRGLLELVRGRDQDALAAFRHAERLAGQVATHHALATKSRAFLLHTRIRLGQTQHVEQALGGMDSRGRDAGETPWPGRRCGSPRTARRRPPPRSRPSSTAPPRSWHPRGWMVQAFLLEAIARDALGDLAATASAVERALDIAELDGAMLPFLLHPAPGLLSRHARHGTAHAALISRILDLLASKQPRSAPNDPAGLHEPLSDSETRILRYLPTNISAPEIAGELTLSVNTVRTHIRHMYEKLGAHGRTDAVERARALGLLAPSSRRR